MKLRLLKSLFKKKVRDMKEFRVLNIVDTTMGLTNQRVAVIELAKVDYQEVNFSTENRLYSFESIGTLFVIAFNSSLTSSIINAAENEEIITLDVSSFIERIELKNGRNQTIFYHENVHLI